MIFIRFLNNAPRLTISNLAPQKYYAGASGYMDVSVKQKLIIILLLNDTVSTPEINDLKENGKMIANNVIYNNVSEYFPVDTTYPLIFRWGFQRRLHLYLKLRVNVCYKQDKIQKLFTSKELCSMRREIYTYKMNLSSFGSLRLTMYEINFAYSIMKLHVPAPLAENHLSSGILSYSLNTWLETVRETSRKLSTSGNPADFLNGFKCTPCCVNFLGTHVLTAFIRVCNIYI